MAAKCVAVGTIAPRSQPAAMRVRGAVVEPTREPIVAQLQEVSSEDVPQESKPFFTWSDETIGGTWTATGRLHRNWIQPEEDWIRTGC